MKTSHTSVYVFDINGTEYSAVAESKFAAKKKLSFMPNVPDGPRILVRTEKHVLRSVSQEVKEEV